MALRAWRRPTATRAVMPVRRIAMSGTPRAAFSGSDEKAVWYSTRVRYSPKMVALHDQDWVSVHSMWVSGARNLVLGTYMMAWDPGLSAVTAVWTVAEAW